MAIVLLVFSFLVYGNSLHNEFMVDDHTMILERAATGNWQSMLLPPQIKDSPGPGGGQFAFRPVSDIVRWGLFRCFGDQQFYYHLVNIFLFALYCFLVYILLSTLTGKPLLSLYSCLLFCVHPINTIPVVYLTGHEIILFGIFGALSLIAFLRYIDTGNKMILGLSLCSYVFSFLTQEVMVILPAYIIAILVFIKRYNWRQVLTIVWPYCLLGLIYTIFRLTFTTSKFTQILNQAPSDISNPLSYLGTLTELVLWYIGKLFIPDNIVLIWSISSIPFDIIIRNILIFGALMVGLTLFIFRFRINFNSFALTWFIIGLLPVSVLCFIYPAMGFIIEPHWFFFSSLGFFMLCANLLCWSGQVTNHKIAGIVFVAVMSVLFMKTQQYHGILKDQKTYCQYWLRSAPHNHGPNFWLADAYMQEGDYRKAQYFFARAITGRFMDWEAYSNLGLIALEEENLSLAKSYFSKSLLVNPQAALVYNNLGTVYLRENNLLMAEEFFKNSVKINPRLVEPRLNLAEIAKRLGQKEQAIRLYEETLAVSPSDPVSLYFLVEYNLESNYPKAEKLGLQILNSPRKIKAGTLTDLGSLFAMRNHTRLASMFYERALKTDPSFKEVYLESGKLQANFEHWTEAISTWEEGLKIDPADSRFSNLIQEVKGLQAQQRASK